MAAVVLLRLGAPAAEPPRQAAVGPIEVLGTPDETDDERGVEARAVAFIDAARHSLHAALYELGLPSIAIALRQARARGVDVRAYLESDNRKSRHEQECLAILADIPLRFDERASLMHHKFMVADAARVWTGSVNLTWTGCHLHYNEAIIVQDERIARQYEDQFEALYNEREDVSTQSPTQVGEARVSCAFGRGGERIGPWLETVESARDRIEVAAFSLTHPALVDALARRARDGLRVDLILDARLARGPAGRRAVARLRSAGCTVRTGGPRPSFDLLAHFGLPRGQDIKIHHKLLLADGVNVVTGSANLSSNGFEHNDENVLRLEGCPPLGRVYQALVERARSASTSQDEGDDAEAAKN